MTKILVVEDDKFLREMISRKLEKEGYEVYQAIDGEKGEEKIKEVKPDIVLLDLILPGINGFEVLEKLKANPALEQVPVIVISNLGQREDIEKGLKMGAVDYLIKAHHTPVEIIAKVGEFLK